MKNKKLSELTVNEWVSGGILLVLMLWGMSSCSENPKNQATNDLDNQMVEIKNNIYNTCMNSPMGDPLLKSKNAKKEFCDCYVKYYSDPGIRGSFNLSGENEDRKFMLTITATCAGIANGEIIDNL